jgi:hypothetical protein
MERPVKCFLCEKPMYYLGEPQHEPEYTMEVKKENEYMKYYIHVKCWERLKEVINFLNV